MFTEHCLIPDSVALGNDGHLKLDSFIKNKTRVDFTKYFTKEAKRRTHPRTQENWSGATLKGRDNHLKASLQKYKSKSHLQPTLEVIITNVTRT